MTEHGPTLVRWARAWLREALGGPAAAPLEGAWCATPRATFVTLRWRDGQLQGCIGSLEAARGIVADVASNAIAAATRDPRSEPVVLADLDELHVELSILSALEPIASERDIRVGSDGVVLIHRGRRATFLPVMWEQLPALPSFMTALRHKAGIRASDPVELLRYTAERFEDPAP